ncbi:hypothetical protein C8R44DRAFT_24917 [Mycena epipterygia]|nr:hypothetical protein C8R44DRAFT_24917 [Mycena epipterygia]
MDMTAVSSPGEHIHDDKYFFDDGDCMVLAGGNIFKDFSCTNCSCAETRIPCSATCSISPKGRSRSWMGYRNALTVRMTFVHFVGQCTRFQPKLCYRASAGRIS